MGRVVNHFAKGRIVILPRRRRIIRNRESLKADTWNEAAMEANYDEDLTKNPFFQVLRRDYSSLFERAVKEGLIVCVPRCGSFAKSALVEDDFLGHIIAPLEENSIARFRTLAGREVKVSNRVLTVDYDIAKPCSAHLLFEETFYTDERSKYSLWCIERPLEQSISASRDDVIIVTNLREALDLIWTEIYDKDIIKEMTMSIEEFQEYHVNFDDESINAQRDNVGALYAKNLRMLLNDTRLREKTESNRYFLQTLKIAAETYTMHGLRNFLPRSISARTSADDAKLNKTIRNLCDLQLRDLGVRTDIYDGILRAKLELSRLNVYSTIIGKIGCLKKSIRYISEGVTLLSSDDILPVLIFLVLRTGLPNWIAQLTFMKQFRFSVNSINEIADESSFLITSLEAAVEHVRSGVLDTSIKQKDTYTEIDNTTKSTLDQKQNADISLQNLFSSIRKSNLTEIERILVGQTIETTHENVKLCHPLCTCDNCETTLADASYDNLPTVNSRDDRGMTALHVASLSGHVNIVDFLLEHSANPNDTDADGTTPLHCASSRGHQNTILLLLHADADPTIVDSRGDTALHLASDHGHDGCVKALLYFIEQMAMSMNKSPVNFRGETPLHHAAKWGYDGIVEILMEHGANPRITNQRGQTPLMVAHNSRVMKILQNIPKIMTARVSRHSSLSTASLNSQESLSKEAKTCESSRTSKKTRKADRLLAAIAENDLRLACYYLGLEAPLKSPVGEIPSFCHPLCNCERCASSEDAMDQHERIPSLGLNICNERKETALHVACYHGRTELVEILLDAGASVNLKTEEGRTPLHLACLSNCPKIVKLLLNCGNCDINAIDGNGDTSLHLVARYGNTRIVQLLIRYGANTDVRNFRGKLALEEMEKNSL